MSRQPRPLPVPLGRSLRALQPGPSTVVRAFDTGASVVLRYRRESFPSAPTARARSTTRALRTMPGGVSSFSAYLREAAATGASLAPYVIEAFEVGQGTPVGEPRRGTAPRPVTPVQAAPVAAPLPAAAPSARETLSPEEALRRHWEESDRRAQARALAEASPEEREAIVAIRRAAGQPTAIETPPAPAAPREPHPHDVFERMGVAMAYANTFDVGDVTLARRFDEMNAVLDREQQRVTSRGRPAQPEPAPPVVDDFSLMQDLIALRDSLPQPAGAAATATTVAAPQVAVAADAEIPLAPATGGMSIGPDALHIGDIIVATTTHPVSWAIRTATGSPVSHAMLYIGGGQVVEAVGSGVTMRSLADAIADASLAVAFRHPTITEEQALRARDFAGRHLDEAYAYRGLARGLRFRLDQLVHCRGKTGEEYQRCRDWYGKVDLGTPTNDEFYCSQLVLAAYADAGLPLTAQPPHWSSPQDIVDLALTSTLAYVGHLKTSK